MSPSVSTPSRVVITILLLVLFALFVGKYPFVLSFITKKRAVVGDRSTQVVMSFHQIVEAQRQYFLAGKPAKLSHRREQLLKLKTLLTEGKDVLSEAVHRDLRRLAGLTYVFELSGLLMEIDYVLEHLEEWSAPITAQRTFVTMLDTPMVVKEPLGVVLVMGPWNFPLFTLLMPLIDVMAAGNCAIVKPSEVASHTAETVGRLLAKSFDPQYLAVVQGGVGETTELLKERFDHIVFTGSHVIARSILKAAAEHLTPCTLELGGKCPAIVEPDVDVDITAKRLVWGKWLNAGQVCIAPDYLIVNAAVKQRLMDAIERMIFQFYGNEIQKSPDFNRIINQRHFDRLATLLQKTNGRKVFDGGQLDRDDLFIPPMIYEVTPDDALMKDELFGPILPVITVDSLSEAIALVCSQGEKPLAVYLFTRSEGKVKRIVEETHSGSVCINDVAIHITVDTLPFGGVGQSGMGRYRGKFGFDQFSHSKGVLKRGFFADGVAAARYPPLNDTKLARLKQLAGSRVVFPRWLKRTLSSVPLVMALVLGYVVHCYQQRLL